jgi:phosphatidate cytidylyltransferase
VSNLAIRVLVAIVGIPVVVLLALAGGYWFSGFIALLATIGILEFYSLAEAKGAHPQKAVGVVTGLFLVSVFLFARLRDDILTYFDRFGVQLPAPTMAQYFLIVVLVAIPLMMLRELPRNRGSALMNIAVTIFGVLYVSFFFGCLVGIRELFIPEDFPIFRNFQLSGIGIPDEIREKVYQWGGYTVLVIFASIWICDSAAYFAGRAFGKNKLFERVSPKKTWEGAVAGLIGAVAAFIAGKLLVLPYLGLLEAGVCGAIVGIAGQMGDLAESLLKRDAGVKDSSALIPGHGGVLDRFDSLLLSSPLLFLFLDFIVF